MNHYVFFTRTLPFHGVGGMEVLIWDLMTEIVRSGQGKISVITTTITNKPDNFIEEGVNIYAIPDVTPRRYTPKWWKLSADFFDRELRKEYSCVISVAMGAAGLLFQRERFHDVPIICQSHGTVLSETISKLRTRNPIQIIKCLRQIKYFIREYRVYKYSSHLVAAGGIVKSTLTKFPYNRYITENKVTLIDNGINTEEFCPSLVNRQNLREKYKIPMDVPLVISVARLIKQKGVAQAIYAFKELLRLVDNARFIIVGDGRERPSLEMLVKELGLGNSVLFVGSIQYSELPKYYQMSDVIVFPTLRMEGAPLNILEALAVGLPVVASNFLTNSSHISKYISFVDPRNPIEVGSAISRSIDLARNEDISLSKIYSIAEMTKVYLCLFDKVKNQQL